MPAYAVTETTIPAHFVHFFCTKSARWHAEVPRSAVIYAVAMSEQQPVPLGKRAGTRPGNRFERRRRRPGGR
jgi:hypothetical protein